MISRIRSIPPSNLVEFLEKNIDLKELENLKVTLKGMKLLKYENRIKIMLVMI
jgi:hypothetical protein